MVVEIFLILPELFALALAHFRPAEGRLHREHVADLQFPPQSNPGRVLLAPLDFEAGVLVGKVGVADL